MISSFAQGKPSETGGRKTKGLKHSCYASRVARGHDPSFCSMEEKMFSQPAIARGGLFFRKILVALAVGVAFLRSFLYQLEMPS